MKKPFGSASGAGYSREQAAKAMGVDIGSRAKCSARKPCGFLEAMREHAGEFGKATGLTPGVNMLSGRMFLGYRFKRGATLMLFGFCPFCGVRWAQ